MAKIELKGKIIAVLPVETVGKEKTMIKQSIVFQVAGYVDAFGDKKGQDEMWKLDVLGQEKIDKIGLTDKDEQSQGTAAVYINSNLIPKTKDREETFIINAVLADFKKR